MKQLTSLSDKKTKIWKTSNLTREDGENYEDAGI